MSISYLVRANTSSGLVNRVESNLRGINTIYILSGVSSYVKSVVAGRIAAYLKEHGECAEYVFSPFSKDYYDAIIIRNKKIAIVDENCLSGMKINVNNIRIDTDTCIESTVLPEISQIEKNIYAEYNKVYKKYELAKSIHDEWERVYVSNMNLSRLNSFNDFTATKILDVPKRACQGSVCERFFGSVYSDGHTNYIDCLTENISKRYFIKGRPGTGKSTFMRRFASKAVSMGYDAEIYFCSFDPYSYDMVVLRDLSVCVFDSTAPHEKMPSESNDEILDFYTHSGLTGIDEKYTSELSAIKSRYNNVMSEATDFIKIASAMYKKSEDTISGYTDYNKMNNLVYNFLNEIF